MHMHVNGHKHKVNINVYQHVYFGVNSWTNLGVINIVEFASKHVCFATDACRTNVGQVPS